MPENGWCSVSRCLLPWQARHRGREHLRRVADEHWESKCMAEQLLLRECNDGRAAQYDRRRGEVPQEGRHYLRCVLVCTHKTFTEGRSIISRSSENGPAFPQASRVQPRSQETCQPSLRTQLAQLTPASLPPSNSSSAPSRCCALSMGEVFESVPLSVSVPLPIHQSAAIPKCIPFKAFVGLQDHTCKTERSAGDSAGDASPNCHRPGRQVEPVMAVLPSCAMVSLRLPPSSCS